MQKAILPDWAHRHPDVVTYAKRNVVFCAAVMAAKTMKEKAALVAQAARELPEVQRLIAAAVKGMKVMGW